MTSTTQTQTSTAEPRLGGDNIRRDLRHSMLDGAAYGAMVGVGETYLPAFALAVGLGEMAAAMVGSLPLVAGGVMQLISPVAVRAMRSHRLWVVTCSAVQALTFIPLAIAAYAGAIGNAGLLLIAAVYWGSGLAAGPAWNTWIGTLVPKAIRPRYFAHRTRVSQAAVFLSFLAGGIVLQLAAPGRQAMWAFMALFVIAAFCRLLSTWALWRQSEPIPMPVNMQEIPWRRIFHHLQASSGGRLLVYLVVVQAAVQMAGPFITPFMLTKLGLSYGELVALLSMAFLAKVIALPVWGRIAKRIGARQLLWIGGVGIVPLGAGWLLSQHFAWIGFLQIAGGVTWAAYELAFFLLIFEAIPERERTSVLTIYNLLNTLAWAGGSLLGGAILFALDMTFYGYLVLFGVSSAGRLLALLLLARVPRLIVDSDAIGMRTVAVRPGSASLDAPVLPSMPDQVGEQ